MDYCLMCTYRLCKASITLIVTLVLSLLPVLSSYAVYNPPFPPIVNFVFNSEAKALAFYDTECDSNNYSWVGSGLGCAVGDPSNVTCTVTMKYFNTDVNYCMSPEPEPLPSVPDPIDYDHQVDGTGNNNYLLKTLQKYTQLQLNADITSQGYLSGIEQSSRNSTSILKSILSKSTNNDGGIIDAIIASDSNARDRAEKVADKDFLTPYLDRAELRDINYQRDDLLSGGSTARYAQEIAYDRLPEINSSIQDVESSVRMSANTVGVGNESLHDIDNKLRALIRTMNNFSFDDDYNLLTNDDVIVAAVGSQTTSLTEKLEQIAQKTQSQTDNYNVKSAQLQAALDAIKSNTSGGTGGGDGGTGEGDTANQNACVSFTCSSQTPACYIARKQWESDCASQAALTDSGALGTFKSELTGFLEHADSSVENIDAGTVDTSSFMSKYTDGSGFSASSASCPAPYTVDIVLTTITLDLTPFCDLAGVIRWFLIAFSSVAAGLMVAKYS